LAKAGLIGRHRHHQAKFFWFGAQGKITPAWPGA
jgi:hypothetical protein